MKISTLAAGVALSALMATGAVAADVYTGDKSLKDDGNYVNGAVHNWSGWYLTGKLGVSRQNYKGSHTGTGEKGEIDEETTGEGDAAVTTFTDVPLKVWSGSSAIDLESDDNLDGEVELSYIGRVGGGLVVEPFLSVSAPLGGKSVGTEFAYQQIRYNADDLSVDNDELEGTGTFSVKKRLDGVAGLKLGFTASRFYFYGGGGLAYGRFNVKGSHDTDAAPGGMYDDGALASGFDKTEGAFGYALMLGTKYALTSRVMLGVEGQYKDFGSIDVGSSTRIDGAYGNDERYVSAGGRNSVDVDEFAIKGTVTIKLSD